MQLLDFLTAYTGLTRDALVGGGSPFDAKIMISNDGFGGITFPVWNVEGVPAPTSAQIATALAAPAPGLSVPRLLQLASDYQNTLLSGVWTFDVGTESAPIKLTTRLDASGQAAMTQLLIWATMLAGPDDVEPYNMADGSAGPNLTPAQAKNLAAQAGAVKSATFATLNQIAAALEAVPPTITTAAQIAAAAWPKP